MASDLWVVEPHTNPVYGSNHFSGFAESYGTKILIGGGYFAVAGGGNNIEEFGAYDTLTDSYTDLPDMPVEVSETYTGIYNHRFFVVAGAYASSAYQGTVRYFNLLTNEWVIPTGLAAMPEDGTDPQHRGTWGGAHAAVGGSLFIFGGIQIFPVHNARHDRAQVFSMASPNSEAELIAPLPEINERARAAVLDDGLIHILGGRGVGGGTVAVHWAYDPQSDSYDTTSFAPLPEPRQGGCVTVAGGVMFYTGGGSEAGVGTNHWQYDAAEDRWIARAELPEGRLYAAGAGNNDGRPSINIFGGLQPPATTNEHVEQTNYRYTVVSPADVESYPALYPAPEKLPHVITLEDTRGNMALQRKLQENFDAAERQRLALEPYNPEATELGPHPYSRPT